MFLRKVERGRYSKSIHSYTEVPREVTRSFNSSIVILVNHSAEAMAALRCWLHDSAWQLTEHISLDEVSTLEG